MSFIISTGIRVAFSNGFFFEMIDVTPPGASRESIPTSHMGSVDAHNFTPAKLVDWGDMVIEMAHHPTLKPPMNDPAENVTITFPDSVDTEWDFNGFMTGYEPAAPLEDRMLATATVKVDGDPTVT